MWCSPAGRLIGGGRSWLGAIRTTRLPAPTVRVRSRLRASGTMPTSLRGRIFRGEASSGWVESCGEEQGERKRRERGRREARSVQASCAFSQAARVCDNALQRRELDFSGRTRCAVEGVACLVIGSSQNRRSQQEENPPISPGVLYQFCQAHQSCTRTVPRGEPARIHLPFADFSTRSRRGERT